jgi:hypothetical protein
MIVGSPTKNENAKCVMPAWIAGIQARKDAPRNIHVDLDSSPPCWNDAVEGAVLKLTEVPLSGTFKGARDTVAKSRKWQTLVRMAALLAVLSGCSLSTPPSHTEVVEQALPKGTRIPPQWVSDPATNGVADDWLKSFKDPALDAIVAESIANNLDLRQAAARVEAARQIVVVVGSKLWPQIGAQFSAATLHDKDQSGNADSYMQYGGISWEVDLWGRIRAQKASAEAGFEASSLDYAFARQSLAATTAKSWYLAIETGQLFALAEEAVNIYARILELVKLRRAAGKAADFDVAQASAALATAQGQLRVYQGNYSEARRALRRPVWIGGSARVWRGGGRANEPGAFGGAAPVQSAVSQRPQ